MRQTRLRRLALKQMTAIVGQDSRVCKRYPIGRLVLLRLGLEVLRRVMVRQFHLDSDKFELEQRRRVVAAIARGDRGFGLRDYKMAAAASLEV